MKNTILKLLVLCALWAACTQADAQRNKLRFIYGQVRNSLTRQVVFDSKVTLMRTDSTVIDTFRVSRQNTYNVGATESEQNVFLFMMDDFKEGGDFILRAEAEGYAPVETAIHCKAFNDRNFMQHAGDLLLRKLPREQALGEATVKATKVKIYHKGDTLVYNADAFQLAEGSMLDALIRQLPGAELKDDGRILVNGKQVESLLLNGEEFFRGNNTVMLDNLPAYMVKTVQVYEKQSLMEEFAGRDLGQQSYVMDVKLKKQYSIGYIGNAEVGYGSADRYLGRLFALRFTPQSRLTLYGNINNLNDNRKPGQDSEWTPDKMPTGEVTNRKAGLDYNVNDRLRRFKLNGWAEAAHNDARHYTRTSSTDFLPQGNTYGRSESLSRSHNTTLATGHNFEFRKHKAWAAWGGTSFNYNRWRSYSTGASATFSDDPGVESAAALMDSIRRPEAGALLRRLATNRTLSESSSHGHSLFSGTNATLSIRPSAADNLTLYGHLNYQSTTQHSFANRLYDYPSASGAQPDFRRQYTDGTPNHNLSYKLSAKYQYFLTDQLFLTAVYEFEGNHRQRNSLLYRLDQLAGWGQDGGLPLGSLPSETEMLQAALDRQNSSELSETNGQHRAGLEVFWRSKNDRTDMPYWRVTAALPADFHRRSLDRYRRADFDGSFLRHETFFSPTLTVHHRWHMAQRQWNFSYALTSAAPALLNLLDIENNADPLNVYHGNADQKSAHFHDFDFNYQNNSTRKGRFFSLYAHYRLTQDAQAWGYTYDRATGIRHYRPGNVNGNYLLTGGVNYTMPLDRPKRLTLSTQTYGQFGQGVDLMENVRSTAKITYITETLRLDYTIGKWKVGAKGFGGWNNARSRREGFTTQNVYDFNYGPTLQVELPWNLQLSTDLTMYSRRGYGDPSANTNDLVWNARFSARIPKLNLTFMVDGFDILGNLSNLTQTMNSQGRFETYRNALPRYVMVHLVYRLNIKPKKRPGE